MVYEMIPIIMFWKLKKLASILLEFTNSNPTICSVNKGVVFVIFEKIEEM